MEIWKDVNNYEGHYQVSSLGRVKALYREFKGSDGKLKKYPERVLKIDTSSSSDIRYARVTLCRSNKTYRVTVHRLVAENFIPNPEGKPHINHIDNDSLNNHLINLEWVTHSENMIHAQKQGRLHNAQSSGGKVGGQVSKQRMLTKVNALIHTTVGGYLVLGLHGYNKHGSVSLLVKCIHCSNIYVRTLTYIVNHPQQGCVKCKHKVKI